MKLASRKWLRRTGLIVGLAGAVWLTLFIFAVSEGRFSWYSVPTVIVFVLPFLAIIAIAWKWSLIGGILLIAGGLFWPVWRLTTMPPTTQPMPLPTLALVLLPVSLPLLASGILFLLSREGRR
ncbi:MAG: hypothetical protein DRI01_08795 [Chloroflexi bacterium]|nr:MAG: hypothetical protein DRI01_08795 [Chloroflexota bacterium]